MRGKVYPSSEGVLKRSYYRGEPNVDSILVVAKTSFSFFVNVALQTVE